MSSEVESLEYAVGRRVRELREEAGVTLDEMARHAREFGLRWSTARVIEFEKGQTRRVTLPVLLAVAQALSIRRGSPVRLRDLVPTDVKWLRITDEWLVRPYKLVDALDGGAVDLGLLTAVSSGPMDVPEDALHPTLAETRAARRLGVRPVDVAKWSHRLWGWPLDDEVRTRAGSSSSPQERGHISRRLVEELGHRMAADNAEAADAEATVEKALSQGAVSRSDAPAKGRGRGNR